jgi:hypothetical protein
MKLTPDLNSKNVNDVTHQIGNGLHGRKEKKKGISKRILV